MGRISRKQRIEWLEKQIAIQEDALTRGTNHQEAIIHAALLERLTNEWVELMRKEK